MSDLQAEQYELGTQYVKPGKSDIISFATRVSGGVCPGNKASIKKKFDTNEDALGFLRLPAGHAIMLASDSHYGALASELAVTRFMAQFQNAEGNILQRLFGAHVSLDTLIREEKAHRGGVYPNCAATLISLYVAPGLVNWCSSGDSHFFLHRDGRMRKINKNHETMFLGDSYCHPGKLRSKLESMGVIDVMTSDLNVLEIMYLLSDFRRELDDSVVDIDMAEALTAKISELAGIPFPEDADKFLNAWNPLNQLVYETAPRWGMTEIQEGDTILLATDGIDEEETGVPLVELEAMIGEESNMDKLAGDILKKCAGKKGGNDNLMFMLAKT